MMRIALVFGCLLIATVAHAQEGPYVVGAGALDVVRVDHAEVAGSLAAPGQGEAPGGSLRLGTAFGDRWGVELEYAWSGDIDAAGRFSSVLQAAPTTAFTSFASYSVVSLFTSRAEQHQSHLAPVLWVRQRLGDSSDIAYLGGLAFTRVVTDSTFSFGPLLAIPELGIPARVPIRQETRTVEYGIQPLVGVEGRIGLTEKLRIVGGLRLQGLADGWVLRPSVGLGWFF